MMSTILLFYESLATDPLELHVQSKHMPPPPPNRYMFSYTMLIIDKLT